MTKHDFTALFLLIFFIPLTSAPPASLVTDGWEHLVCNRPAKAAETFKKGLSRADPLISGKALRGLSYVNLFFGNEKAAMETAFKSFLKDNDTLLFSALTNHMINFSRTGTGNSCSPGYEALTSLTETPSVFNGQFFSALAQRYINDGDLRNAGELTEKMNIVRTFRMAGPFENISGSGYDKAFGPEKDYGFNFDTLFTGKNNAEIRWFPFYNKKYDGWVFTEYNYDIDNAVIYYYSDIHSENSIEARLCFGASGAFKVFLNGSPVLADSVFRNTGTDMFIQTVELDKGSNPLLIKLCHEEQSSNFLIRITDKNGKKPDGITFKSGKPESYRRSRYTFPDILPTPVTEKITAPLISRLDKNPEDLEAALLLIDYYNMADLTSKSKHIIEKTLSLFPESSLLHSRYSEALLREKRPTESETEMKKAYKLCGSNFEAWLYELELLINNAGCEDIINFIDSSKNDFGSTEKALITKYLCCLKNGNNARSLELIDSLISAPSRSGFTDMILYSSYLSQGKLKPAKTILENHIEKKHTSTDIYSTLSSLYMKKGSRRKAVKTLYKALEYNPVSPGFYYYLADLYFKSREYDKALENIDSALSISPVNAEILNLKGSILSSAGNQDDALSALKLSTKYNYDNFNAWKQIYSIENKAPLNSLSSRPGQDSLINASSEWEHKTNERGSIIAYYKDIFIYPSRCSQEEIFFLIHLPTKKSIDIWKEYSIPFNPYYQKLTVKRALSVRMHGKQTPAEINGNSIIFKSLESGDNILVEYAVENHYSTGMAGKLWGSFSFDLDFPVYSSGLNIINTLSDTVNYTVQGNDISKNVSSVDGHRKISFSRGPYNKPVEESYEPISLPSENLVYYSTFDSWKEISNWYYSVSDKKSATKFNLKNIIDSVLTGSSDITDTVSAIHSYITQSIRYSYVPFRQSAWVPRSAENVTAEKIGDCKDMASLGKCIFEAAGIKCNLVLVNTRDRNSIYPTFKGPNFNHCILSYIIDCSVNYIDFTAKDISYKRLPEMDQGALALVIRPDNDSLIHLPVDLPEDRVIERKITSRLDSNGTLRSELQTLKTGVFASQSRMFYRYKTPEEQINELNSILSEYYHNVSADSIYFENLKSLEDSLNYFYSYNAEDVLNFSGNTAVFTMNFPDKINGRHFPSEKSRIKPVDMTKTWFNIGTYNISGNLLLPDGWHVQNCPITKKIKGKYGTYTLNVTQNKNDLSFKRTAKFNFNKPVQTDEYPEIRNFLTDISKTDELQLIIKTSD